MKNRIILLLKKYETYVGNIEWHIKNNKPWGSELAKYQEQLKCYKEMVSDLKAFKIKS